MKFPAILLSKNRPKKDSKNIKNWNYLYTRHKPSDNWKEEEGLPDFSKIKTNQSCNWCNYSIPAWVRFNDQKEYLHNYAVAGFKVDVIRNKHVQENVFQFREIDVNHEPIATNYSHCEFKEISKLSKKDRRAWRATIRHKCRVHLKPYQTISPSKIFLGIIYMYIRRWLTKLPYPPK